MELAYPASTSLRLDQQSLCPRSFLISHTRTAHTANKCSHLSKRIIVNVFNSIYHVDWSSTYLGHYQGSDINSQTRKVSKDVSCLNWWFSRNARLRAQENQLNSIVDTLQGWTSCSEGGKFSECDINMRGRNLLKKFFSPPFCMCPLTTVQLRRQPWSQFIHIRHNVR